MSEKEDFWNKLARTIIRSGPLPFPITDALLEILKTVVNEEQGKFVFTVFRRPSMSREEINKKVKKEYDEATIDKYLNDLMDGGVITGIPSKSTGMMVYYLMPFFPGIFEWSLLKGKKGPKEQKLAKLYDTIFGELGEVTQKSYDIIVDQFKNFNAMDRVVPVEEEIAGEIEAETVLPFEELSKIIDANDTFCVVHCYCRMQKEMLGRPCKATNDREICMMFGKTAQFCIDHKFGKQKTKEEIKQIMKKVEDQGLVHKAIHTGLDPKREIAGFCNCCKCCCGIFELWYRGVTPLMSYASFISKVYADKCTACGTCVERCPVEAVEIIDTIATVKKDRCLGCGVCAHFCPEKAITLERLGKEPRMVYVPPPKLKR